MRRALWLATAGMTVLAASATAQASLFGIRGLGLPGRGLSARSLSLGGGYGLFDGESSLNPAALSTLSSSTAMFTSTGSWGNATNPLGASTSRDTRFPQVLVGGPIPGGRVAIGVSDALYTDRDFTVVSDGVAAPRGVNVPVHDTLSSRGGVDDVRIGVSWRAGPTLALGGGVHFLTGSNRLLSRRFWEDTSYHSPSEAAELSYSGIGFSVGVLWQPSRFVLVAAAFRHDGALTVDRDSTGVGQVLLPPATIGVVRMPTTISGAIRLSPSSRLSIMGTVISRNWSVADSSLKAQGAPGARNTFEMNGGIELVRDAKRPNKYPLRLGVWRSTLPFLLGSDPQPNETGFSIGSGRRFAADRGGFDFALQRVRRTQGSAFTESAWMVTIGLSVRPGGLTP